MPATVRSRADLSVRQDITELRSAERARCLCSFWSADGACYGLEGWFSAEHGVVIERALQRFAERVPEFPTDLVYDDGSPVPAEIRADVRRADALHAICTGELSADPDPERATVVVHVELESLRSADGACEIEDGPVVHSEVAARLCCDARLQVMLRDERNRIVGVGWSARRPPRWLLRALRRRDEGCVFPGCCFKRFVHAHHIVRWPEGPHEPRQPRARVPVPPQARSRACLDRGGRRRRGRGLVTSGRHPLRSQRPGKGRPHQSAPHRSHNAA